MSSVSIIDANGIARVSRLESTRFSDDSGVSSKDASRGLPSSPLRPRNHAIGVEILYKMTFEAALEGARGI
jgi:hypothetical protein